jgi:hypothetical protein
MNKLRMVTSLAAVIALACLAFAANASATTLEVKGVKQSTATTIDLSLVPGTSLVIRDTPGFFVDTCTTATLQFAPTSVITGSAIVGPDNAWVLTGCTEGNPTVDAKGSLSVEWIKNTTNGTVKSKNAKVTVPSALGLLTCTTPEAGTDLGTLTGVSSGKAHLNTQAIMSCGVSVVWEGDFYVTSPEGLGVTE